MNIDYSPFLHCLENGSLWWRLDDAIKLGAGYLPVHDEGNPVPVLRANSNRVRANERNLLAEFSPEHYSASHPLLLVRDDGRYVEAYEFLTWLSRYVGLMPSEISFPDELARAVAQSVALVPHKFESLVIALEPWFDKTKEELPDEQRRRVAADFFPMPWNELSPEQRRSVAMHWDDQHDPATESNRRFWWGIFFRRSELERQIAQWKAAATPRQAIWRRRKSGSNSFRKNLPVWKDNSGRQAVIILRGKRLLEIRRETLRLRRLLPFGTSPIQKR